MEKSVNFPSEEAIIQDVEATPVLDGEGVEETPDVSLRDTMANLSEAMKQAHEMIGFQRMIWEQMSGEMNIDAMQVETLLSLTDNNGEPLLTVMSAGEDQPPVVTGISDVPVVKIHEIFPNANIYSGDWEGTITILSSVVSMYRELNNAVLEYVELEKEYMQLADDQESTYIQYLQSMVNSSQDEEKRTELQNVLDNYIHTNLLGFMSDPVSKDIHDYIVNIFKDESRIKYVIDRAIPIVTSLGISTESLMSLFQFESRHLPEKYWCNDNLLFMYFLNTAVFQRKTDEKLISARLISMAMHLKRIADGSLAADRKDIILNNIYALEEQFLGEIDGTSSFWKADPVDSTNFNESLN